MIAFDEMDARLKAAGRTRAWLAEQVPYSRRYIGDVLAPHSTRRSGRIQKVLSDAIEAEERRMEERKLAMISSVPLLSLLADIRAAVGDPEGKLMQDELVERCRQLRGASDTMLSALARLKAWVEAGMSDSERRAALEEAKRAIMAAEGCERRDVTPSPPAR